MKSALAALLLVSWIAAPAAKAQSVPSGQKHPQLSGRDGKIVDSLVGLKGKGELEDSIKKALAAPPELSEVRTARRLISDNRNRVEIALLLGHLT
jgi:hypothetical protein